MSSLELEYLQRPLRDKPSKLTITTSPFPPTPTSLDDTQRFSLLASRTPLAFLHAKREEIEEEERERGRKRDTEKERDRSGIKPNSVLPPTHPPLMMALSKKDLNFK